MTLCLTPVILVVVLITWCKHILISGSGLQIVRYHYKPRLLLGKFVDWKKISLRAGNGGNGSVSFVHSRCVGLDFFVESLWLLFSVIFRCIRYVCDINP